MTVLDFITECENWNHSKESLEMLKECSEIAIMEKYIADQKWCKDHCPAFTALNISSDYFGESVTDGAIEVLMEKSILKKKSLMHRILQGLLKIIQGFWSFTGKISKNFDQTTKDAAAIVKAMGAKVLTDEEAVKVNNIAANAREKCPGFVPTNKQPFASKMHLSYENGDPSVGVQAAIAAGLADDKVVAFVGINAENDSVGALPISTLRKAGASLVSGLQSAKIGDIMGAITTLTTSWKDVQLKGLEISVIPKEIDRASAQLKEVMGSIDGIMGMTDQIADAGKGMVKDLAADKDAATRAANRANPDGPQKATIGETADKVTAAMTEGMNKLYGMINSSIGASTRMYSDYSKYRKMIIAGLKPIFLGTPETAEPDGSDAAPAEV